MCMLHKPLLLKHVTRCSIFSTVHQTMGSWWSCKLFLKLLVLMHSCSYMCKEIHMLVA